MSLNHEQQPISFVAQKKLRLNAEVNELIGKILAVNFSSPSVTATDEEEADAFADIVSGHRRQLVDDFRMHPDVFGPENVRLARALTLSTISSYARKEADDLEAMGDRGIVVFPSFLRKTQYVARITQLAAERSKGKDLHSTTVVL